MPSPIGHALAGLAVAWSSGQPRPHPLPQWREPLGKPQSREPRDFWTLPVICAGLAVFPDFDLLYLSIHRTVTHSVGAVILVTIIAAAVTGWVTSKVDWRIAITCGAAYATHLVLDYFANDPGIPSGIQLLWPFSRDWFISAWKIFPETEREELFTARSMIANAKAITFELVTMGPIAVALGLRRFRRAGRAG